LLKNIVKIVKTRKNQSIKNLHKKMKLKERKIKKSIDPQNKAWALGPDMGGPKRLGWVIYFILFFKVQTLISLKK